MFKIIKRKKPKSVLDEKRLSEMMQTELGGYLKREELREYLENIEKDKVKKQLWASLSLYKKLKLLRFALEQKGASHGKK